MESGDDELEHPADVCLASGLNPEPRYVDLFEEPTVELVYSLGKAKSDRLLALNCNLFYLSFAF